MKKYTLTISLTIVLLIFCVFTFTNCKNESLNQETTIAQEDEKQESQQLETAQGEQASKPTETESSETLMSKTEVENSFISKTGYTMIYNYSELNSPIGDAYGTQSFKILSEGMWKQVANITEPRPVTSAVTYIISEQDGYYVINSGIWTHGADEEFSMDGTFNPYEIIVPINLVPVNAWNENYNVIFNLASGDSIEYNITRNCSIRNELETISVTTGEFECMVVDYVRNQKTISGTGVDTGAEGTEWWAPEIGKIKEVQTSISGIDAGTIRTLELASYSK